LGRLILVSNRLPFTARRQAGETVLVRSSGGLVAGLGPVHEAKDALWIGNLGGEIGGLKRDQLRKNRIVPIAISRDRARRHYEGFSNGVLWPLFHYFLESVKYDPDDFEAYRAVNQQFAEVVAQHARSGDRIWIHDYHLMLMPTMIRQMRPDVTIGFFLHIPVPSSEVFRVLPVAEIILEGLMGADLIGLHTYDYVRHLTTAYRRFLGRPFDLDSVERDGGRCHVRAFPLGVDAKGFVERAGSAEVERRLTSWRRKAAGRKVLLGVDRLDYSKGIPLRLEAWRRLLSRSPAWRRQAVFLQLAVPSRGTIDQYRQLKAQVEQQVGEINGEFSDMGTMPVHYMHRTVPPDELVALYRLADVAVVTPLRDGMNLVAKEFIASRVDEDGVLVLSEFAGAASELGEALVVNPWDLEGTARALDRALRMDPVERHRRMSSLRGRVLSYDAERWAQSFLDDLRSIAERRTLAEEASASKEWAADLARRFGTSKTPMVVLGYDGTLKGFEMEPHTACPDDALIRLILRLHAAGVAVVLISGRDRDTLESWFGEIPIHLVAEHGFLLRPADKRTWEELAPGIDRSWFPVVEETMRSYVDRTPGSFIERKQAGLAWHYRRAEPGLGLRQGRELAHHLTEYFANRPVRVIRGACVVEANTQGIDKGWAYRALQRRVPASDLVVMAGDDRTDEDMFRAAAASVWSIKVGAGETVARHRVPSPERLRALLSEAASAREEASERRRAAPKIVQEPAPPKKKSASLRAGPAEPGPRKLDEI